MANDCVASTSPDFNTTSGLAQLLDSLNQKQVALLDGAITIKCGIVVVTKGSAAALTLAAPTAGSISAGGDDCKILTVKSTTAFAHTITTPANKINGNKLTDTFGGAVTDCVEFVAYNGVWWTVQNTGGTLS